MNAPVRLLWGWMRKNGSRQSLGQGAQYEDLKREVPIAIQCIQCPLQSMLYSRAWAIAQLYMILDETEVHIRGLSRSRKSFC